LYPARPIWPPEQDIDVLNGWMLFLGGLRASHGAWEVLYGDVKRRRKKHLSNTGKSTTSFK
jgi:hypothetical protein